MLVPIAYADIHTTISATADSGGNYVGQGGTVVTGDSTASVEMSNTAGGNSSSSVYIKTNVNGTVHEETYTATAPVNVQVEATSQATKVKVEEGNPPKVMRQETIVATTTATNTPEAEGSSTTTTEVSASLTTQIIVAIQGFFANLFNWFK